MNSQLENTEKNKQKNPLKNQTNKWNHLKEFF